MKVLRLGSARFRKLKRSAYVAIRA